ncbi:MAG: pilus assembly protein [Hyphomicrobiales bacterium]|nr:pilus assembly protein [Hyphomicrobiales bacterium]MCP5371598.1 pilus assembly protein [Hyphomicrobiales bacterium]
MKSKALLNLFRRFRRNRDGSPMIEFALAAPALFLIVAGTMELGLAMVTNVLMESSLREAARWGITGQELEGESRLEHILAMIDRHTLGLVDMGEAKLQILTYPGFDQVGRGEEFVDGNGNGTYDAGETFTDSNGNGGWDADMGVAGAGASGEVVVYRILYKWPFLTPLVGKLVGDQDGKLGLRASVAVRNEPWNGDKT